MNAASAGRSANLPFLLAAIVLLSLNLRPALVTIGPVLPAIGRTLHLSGPELGLLTSLPIFALGVASGFADRLGRAIGWGYGTILASASIAAGIALRSADLPLALYLGALLIGLGIGLGCVYVPALLKGSGSRRIGALMGVYSSTLTIGAATSAAFTPALSRFYGGDWRPTLAFFAYPALLCTLCWLPLRKVTAPPLPPQATNVSLRRSPLAWAVTINMGVQSTFFYSLTSWLGTLLQHDRGLSIDATGVALAAFFIPQLFTAFGVPIVLARTRHQGLLAASCAALAGSGIIGTLYAPAAWIPLFCFVIGASIGGVFGIALAFMVLRTAHAKTAARLSGMAQSVGYMLAAVGPLMLGVLRSAADPLFASAIWMTLLASILMLTGVLAGRNATVDDPVVVNISRATV
jgi:CP family cyanate transporter-like MFS transporter